MDECNGKFRKKSNFSIVSNYILRDNCISLKAKGLYALIQSCITIKDFTLYKGYLQSKCCEGKKAFESAWQELKKSGYLVQYRMQDKESKQFYWEYELLDRPMSEPGFIYVMKNMGVYKIGKANSKARRFGEYTRLPEKPEYVIFEYVSNNNIVEWKLKEVFAQKRLREGKCEWFNLDDDDIEKIKQIISKDIIDVPNTVDMERVAKFMAG